MKKRNNRAELHIDAIDVIIFYFKKFNFYKIQ